ncbi:MAG TPA: dockerin type I repeat-containing protein [candidate division Zixibacteria bacterium]|nr:dockerin type I repeat-containing protein [candidate division Zixibacteria bacterium]
MFNRFATIALALMLLTGASLRADWVPEDGHKMHYPQLPNETGWAVNATSPNAIADDWMCSESGYVKDIHLWGAWMGGLETTIDSFTLSIYDDIPAEESPTGFSMPGNLLWSKTTATFIVAEIEDLTNAQGWYDPVSAAYYADDHIGYFQYNFFFDQADWYWQEEGTVYWLVVSVWVDQNDTYQWGWVSTENHWNDDAVWPIDLPTYWQDIYEPPAIWDYMHGDMNGDGTVNISDVVYFASWYEYGGPAPECDPVPGTDPLFYPCADCNGDCVINAIDLSCWQGYYPWNTCPDYPPKSEGQSLNVAFVINGSPYGPELGACCEAETYLCYQATGDDCVAAGGTFAGAGVSCDPNPCDTCLWQYPGDVDNDGSIDIGDVTYLAQYLYLDGSEPENMANADASGDCCIDSYDLFMIWQYLYYDLPQSLVECTCQEPQICFTDPVPSGAGDVWCNIGTYQPGDGNPIGTVWDDWGDAIKLYYTIQCFVDQDGDGNLSALDTISVLDPMLRMSHHKVVQMRTAAVFEDVGSGDTVYMSAYGSTHGNVYSIFNPWGSLWVEAFPESGPTYELVYWYDFPITFFAVGQRVLMQHLDGPDSLGVRELRVLTLDTGALVQDEESPSCCVLVGDVNHSGTGPDIADLVYLVNYMFNGGPEPPCMEEAWGIGGGEGIDISDLVYLVGYMFQGFAPPPPCSCPW